MTPITCVCARNYIPENNQKASNQNINSGCVGVFGKFLLPLWFSQFPDFSASVEYGL